MRVALGLVLGALCAAVISCGGSAMKSSAAPGAAPQAGGVAGPADPHAQIEALARQIDADLDALDHPRPRPPAPASAGTCVGAVCGSEPLSAPAHPQVDDPTCRPGPSEACQDACRLSASICDSSGRICRIAADLGGGDAYANEKCAGGKASCETARGRCCGCQ